MELLTHHTRGGEYEVFLRLSTYRNVNHINGRVVKECWVGVVRLLGTLLLGYQVGRGFVAKGNAVQNNIWLRFDRVEGLLKLR